MLLQQNALNALRERKLPLFVDIVNETVGVNDLENGLLPEGHPLHKPLEGGDGKTLLFCALEDRCYEYVQVLLSAGVNPNTFCSDLNLYPIHQTCNASDLTALKLLIRYGADVNVKLPRSAQTPLHVCAEKGFKDGVEFLLRSNEIDVDPLDKKGQRTPLYLAACKSQDLDIVRLLIKHNADFNRECFGKSIKKHMEEKLIGFDPTSVPRKLAKPNNHTKLDELASLIESAELTRKSEDRKKYLDQFKSLIIGVHTMELESYEMLEKACKADLTDFAEVLIEVGSMDPNVKNNSTPPLMLAGFNCNIEMTRLLMKHGALFDCSQSETDPTVLHAALRQTHPTEIPKTKAYINYLLGDDETKEHVERIINRRDLIGNTPMHIAVQRWTQDVVKLLLERGANVGMRNDWNHVPVTGIAPETLEEFLDQHCVTSNCGPTIDVQHRNLEITFDYSFLAPPNKELPLEIRSRNDEESALNKQSEERSPQAETESLWHIGQSKQHRHLLKHPVFTSFLWCKWARIRRYFNRNLRFYLLFVYVLTWFIFDQYGNLTSPLFFIFYVIFTLVLALFIFRDWKADVVDVLSAEETLRLMNRTEQPPDVCIGPICRVILSNWAEVLLLGFMVVLLILQEKFLWFAIITLWAVLILREFFQVTVSIKRYILSPENWLEVSTIILVSIILFHSDAGSGIELKRHMAAVAIVLSWAELITLVGKHPKLTRYNVYVTMFYRVLATFIFFLGWYAFFIVAFGLAFYIMLHGASTEYIYFNNPWTALVKTSTMFVGELEFSDIPIDVESSLAPVAFLFLLSFVFLIVVVLMNLLNGLAVSDTGIIQEKAEIVSYISRVETISYTESVLLGDQFDFLSFKRIKTIPSLSLCSRLYKNRTFQSLIWRITRRNWNSAFLQLFARAKVDHKAQRRSQ